MKNRKIGIVAMILIVTMFASLACAASYIDEKSINYTGYVFTDSVGSILMTYADYSNVTTTGVGNYSSGSKCVIQSKVKIERDGETVNITKYDAVERSVAVSAQTDKAAQKGDVVVHTVTRYNTSNKVGYLASGILDKIQMEVTITN